MKFYVKTWDSDKATLMTEYGHVPGYYNSITEALNTCNEWYLLNTHETRQQVNIDPSETEPLNDSNIYDPFISSSAVAIF